MAILRMLDQAARPLSASGLANAVRGARGSDVARDHPEFEQLPSFGALRGTAYDAVLEDVLAMWAKGYLRESEQASRLLELTDQGRAALRACQ
jgi:hypothetical protein